MQFFLPREIVEPVNSRSHCVITVEMCDIARPSSVVLGRQKRPRSCCQPSHISNSFGIICQGRKVILHTSSSRTALECLPLSRRLLDRCTTQYLYRAKQLLILLSYARKAKFLLLFSKVCFKLIFFNHHIEKQRNF